MSHSPSAGEPSVASVGPQHHIPRGTRPRTSPSPVLSRKLAPLSLSTALDGVDSSPEDSADDDLDTSLPFPVPLPRSDFLKPEPFDPSAYLSSAVANRYQTLEDLRTELRTRVQSLNSELVELVNAHQEEFVGLGSSLHGGEERVEELRVGVLGLLREIGDVRGAVGSKEKQVAADLEERRRCRADIEIGRTCLELEESLGVLEGKLRLQSKRRTPIHEDESEDSDEDEDDGEGPSSSAIVARLERRVRLLITIERRARQIGIEHPFGQAQERRVEKCREALLLELGSCLKGLNADDSIVTADSKLRVLRLYGDLKSSRQAIAILKQFR